MSNNSNLTREQKARLAGMLLTAAGNILEFWGEHHDVDGIDYDAAAAQLTTWLQRLPGDQWDMRLPLPR